MYYFNIFFVDKVYILFGPQINKDREYFNAQLSEYCLSCMTSQVDEKEYIFNTDLVEMARI